MTRKRKRCSKKPTPFIKKKSKTSLAGVNQQKYPLRRYEPYHEKFLTYSQIRDFLVRLQKSCPNIMQVSTIGLSTKGRPIYMAVISEGDSTSKPKSGTMIVAGANGTEWFTVSSALYMIEQLVKGRNLVKIMDYFIIPCSNPDAYECSLENKGKEINAMDLSRNFPFSLGIYDLSGISNEVFFKAIREWKENYRFDCPERLAVIKAVLSYQVAIKLFISLEGDGTKITYPFGFCNIEISDVEDLKKVAKAGKSGIKCRCFAVGSMYNLDGMRFGSMVDYIKMCQGSIKFTYTIHVNEKEKNLNPCKILCYGQDVMNCVRFMAKNIYMLYDKTEINSCDDFFAFIVICIWRYMVFIKYLFKI
ncbi:carboxypeptidase A1-like [Anoplophora glabripennis]|uniref:carboxypeptidase A1-like n=1 Tax=Anoplophora glabripennis TaxID=217634 RepID=UPI0008741E35|nr:carboxypeptidase A1-like [Anoplophora glabripennis]